VRFCPAAIFRAAISMPSLPNWPQNAPRFRITSSAALPVPMARARNRFWKARAFRVISAGISQGLTEAELVYLYRNEWARTAEDVLWRRSKLGLHTLPQAAPLIDAFLAGLHHG
jgi:uncharacterized iron-regulated membrane protein